MRGVLLACLLVVTFEQPIGHSMDGFLIRYTVSWCPDHYLGPQIQVEERVVNGKTDAMIGAPRTTFYPVPGAPAPAAPKPEPAP